MRVRSGAFSDGAARLQYEARPCDSVAGIDARPPTVYVDFAGAAVARRSADPHFGGALRYSASIGAARNGMTPGSGSGLPGPRPTLCFAPAQVKKRSAPPPEGWGREGLEQRIAQAWAAFVDRVEV